MREGEQHDSQGRAAVAETEHHTNVPTITELQVEHARDVLGLGRRARGCHGWSRRRARAGARRAMSSRSCGPTGRYVTQRILSAPAIPYS